MGTMKINVRSFNSFCTLPFLLGDVVSTSFFCSLISNLFLMAHRVFLVGPSLLACTWRDYAQWTFISITSSFPLHPFPSFLFNIFTSSTTVNNPLATIVVGVRLPTYNICKSMILCEMSHESIYVQTSINSIEPKGTYLNIINMFVTVRGVGVDWLYSRGGN